MDRNTIISYGLIVISLITVVTLMFAFTPLGKEVTNGIEILSEHFMNNATTDKITNDRDEVINNGDKNLMCTLTLNYVYENGQSAMPSKVLEHPCGTEIKFLDDNLIPEVKGFQPNFTPSNFNLTENTSYTITYYPKQMNIKYELNGGTIVSSKPNIAVYGQTIQLPTKVVKEGHNFLGWYNNADFSGTPITTINEDTFVDNNGAFKKECKVHAKWEKSVYKITYISNGEDITASIVNDGGVNTIEYGQSHVIPMLKNNGNLYFAGWYDNPNFKGNSYTFLPSLPTDNLTFYAKWNALTGYRIEYHLEGGFFDDNTAVPFSYNKGFATTLPTDAQKTGYDFSGWYSDAACTQGPVTSISATSTGDKSYYAKWTPKTYEIEYIDNGGTPVPGSTVIEKYTHGTHGDILLHDMIKEGYTFSHWENIHTHQILYKITPETQVGNLQLMAIYEAKSYNVTVNANGGYFPEANNASTYTTSVVFNTAYGTFETPLKIGYTFNSAFATDPNGDATIVSQTIFNTPNDIEIYAQWSPITYNINYNYNGGTVSNTSNPTQATYNEEFQITDIPQKDNYTFTGWEITSMSNDCTHIYGDETTTNTSIPSTTATTFKNLHTKDGATVTFTAMWTPNTYTITYDTKGGSLVDGITTYTYGDNIVLPTPTKENYVFEGWLNVDTNSKINTISPTSSGNLYLEATWKAPEIEVIITLVNPDDTPYLQNEQPVSVVYDVEFGTTLTIAENEAVEKTGLNNLLYHNATSFKINSSVTNFNIVVYPYIQYNISAQVKDHPDISMNIYSEEEYKDIKIKHPQLHNGTLDWNLDIYQHENNSIKQFTFAQSIMINGNEYACDGTAETFENLLLNNIDDNETQYDIVILYNENPFSITYENIDNLDGFDTQYYSSKGYNIPKPEKTCYIFDGWLLNGQLLQSEEISAGTTGDVILTANWSLLESDSPSHDYEITKPVTCTDNGEQTCKHCQTVIPIFATGHKPSIFEKSDVPLNAYVDDMLMENLLPSDYHFSKCENCSDVYLASEHQWEIESTDSVTQHLLKCSVCKYEKHEGHDLQGVKDNKDNQTHSSICGICNFEYKVPHNYYIVQHTDTLLQDEFHQNICIDCNHTENVEHSLVFYVTASADEVEEGYYYCKKCEAEIGLNHNHNYIVSKEATCLTSGQQQCTYCLRTRIIPFTGHTVGTYSVYDTPMDAYINDMFYENLSPTNYHFATCINEGCSGVYFAQEHNLETKSIDSETQHALKCSGCEYETYENHEMQFSPSNTDPDNFHVSTCQKCSYQNQDTLSSHILTSSPDEENPQKHIITCQECKYGPVSLYHSWYERKLAFGDNGPITSPTIFFECNTCLIKSTEMPTHEHPLTFTNTGHGYHEYKCTECEDYTGVSEHYYKIVSTESTHQYVCACGDVASDATPHNIAMTPSSSSTTSNLYHMKYCKECLTITEEKVPHSWVNVNNGSTDEKEEYCCSDCFLIITLESQQPHNINDPEEYHYYKIEGYKDGDVDMHKYTCYCGKEKTGICDNPTKHYAQIDEQHHIACLCGKIEEHTFNTTPPTCTEKGFAYCIHCNYSYEIDETGHNFVNSVCTNCEQIENSIPTE